MGGFLSEKATLLCALSMRKGVKNNPFCLKWIFDAFVFANS
jgi:hypothetical protein